MRRITTFRSTTERIYDGGLIRLYYNNIRLLYYIILYYIILYYIILYYIILYYIILYYIIILTIVLQLPAAFTLRKFSWYSFLLEAESTPGP